jgi:hypothetical protein
MTRPLLCTVLILGCASAAAAQEPGTPPAVAFAIEGQWQSVDLEKAEIAGKLVNAFEMRTTKNLPYSADATTEFVQVLADGNRIARRSVTRIFRDSEGRVRRENVRPDGSVESISISDPVTGRTVVLDPDRKIASTQSFRFSTFENGQGAVMNSGASGAVVARGRGASAEPIGEKLQRAAEEKRRLEEEIRRAQPAVASAAGPGERVRMRISAQSADRQELGEQAIEGVVARGSRTTTTIAAGAIGNDLPIRIVSEEWFSSELQVLVQTKHSDPRSGETTYTLSNIVRQEPVHSLFEVPPDYTQRR